MGHGTLSRQCALRQCVTTVCRACREALYDKTEWVTQLCQESVSRAPFCQDCVTHSPVWHDLLLPVALFVTWRQCASLFVTVETVCNWLIHLCHLCGMTYWQCARGTFCRHSVRVLQYATDLLIFVIYAAWHIDSVLVALFVKTVCHDSFICAAWLIAAIGCALRSRRGSCVSLLRQCCLFAHFMAPV